MGAPLPWRNTCVDGEDESLDEKLQQWERAGLVAANWDEIPDAAKLATGSSFLLGLLLAAIKLDGRAGNGPRDVLLLLHQLMVLGNIGLVAQVFHLSGHPWRPFAVAAVMGIRAALVAARAIHTDLVLGLAFLALGLWLDQAERGRTGRWARWRWPSSPRVRAVAAG